MVDSNNTPILTHFYFKAFFFLREERGGVIAHTPTVCGENTHIRLFHTSDRSQSQEGKARQGCPASNAHSSRTLGAQWVNKCTRHVLILSSVFGGGGYLFIGKI